MSEGQAQPPGVVVDNPTPWVARHIAEYVATDGTAANDQGWPLLLLTTLGRRSGTWFRTALICGEVVAGSDSDSDGSAYVVVASLGGAPRHPNWYLNLEAHPEVYVQVAAERFRATARTAHGEERVELWEQMARIFPTYDTYQAKTDREIPVVVLERVEG